MSVSIYIPTNSARVFPFLHILSSIYCVQTFDDGYSDWCKVIPPCSFDFHLSNNEQCWTSFHFVSHLYIFFEEMSVQVSFPLFDWGFVFLVSSRMGCLHILEINHLSAVSFAIIISHSEDCLFTLLIIFFAV